MKTDAKIRAKEPCGPIRNAKDALEAFQRLNTYRDAARTAQTRAGGYTPGVHSFYVQLDREALYDGVASRWEAVLGDWLRAQADATRLSHHAPVSDHRLGDPARGVAAAGPAIEQDKLDRVADHGGRDRARPCAHPSHRPPTRMVIG